MTWIGEDLREAQGNYDLLAMASHHPFFGDYGSGDSFDDPANRDEIIALSHQTGVRVAISGHTHVDNFFLDTGGPEDIIHLNTTSTTFGTKEYPGFRPISITGGYPVTYYYRFNSQTACYSYPTYKDTILKKHTDPVEAWLALTSLHTPSVEGWFSSTAPAAFPKDFTSRNNLTEGEPPVNLDQTVIDFLVPDLGDPALYQITNGILLRYWNPISGYYIFQILMDTNPPGGEVTATIDATIPLPEYSALQSGDYNGDGISDIAVFRPSAGLWAVRGLGRLYYGQSGDIPVSGEYTGEGYASVAIYRPGSSLWAVKDYTRLYFGNSNDLPAPGDYDGDGTCDMAVFSRTTGRWSVKDITRVYFGGASDRPVPADYDGDGTGDIALFRPSTGLWAVREVTRLYFGAAGDIPVPGVFQWYGTGRKAEPFKTQPAVFRPGSSLWAIRGGVRYYFGMSGDNPVIGDFEGGFMDTIAVFRPGSSLWAIRNLTRAYFGSTGDIPVTR